MMANRDDKISQEIDALLSSIRKNSDESYREYIQSYAKRVFINPTRPTMDSHSELKEKITSKVMQSGDARAVTACQDVTQRFLTNNAVYRKQEVLTMLLKLSDLNQQEDSK